MFDLPVNKCQTPIQDLHLEEYPDEVVEQFYDFVTNVPFIKNLISADRPFAKGLVRDDEGKIIVDITKPHILEDMDYFRPSALHWAKTGKFTDLHPNKNPNSEYYKWYQEEKRRIFEGYVRESDGEWIPGDLYWYWNYSPIELVKQIGERRGVKGTGMPRVWDGTYLKAHYIHQAKMAAKHTAELASRGRGKSYYLASMSTKRLVLGAESNWRKNVETFIAAYRKDYLNDDGIINKIEKGLDFLAEYTQFPRKRLISSLDKMHYVMGYVDNATKVKRGSKNELIGISMKDSPAKLRGKRGALIGLEEFGSFNNLIELYGTLRPSMEEGEIVYGMIMCQGTAGDSSSDFAAAQQIMYGPDGFNVYSVPNVYDKYNTGRKRFVYFFPAYLNRSNCYDNDGNSDVTKALLQILMHRYTIRHGTTNLSIITKSVSEEPIVPQEAILRAKGGKFPTTQINERISQLENNSSLLDDVNVGALVIGADGKVKFTPTTDTPIRDYPLKKDDSDIGAFEIYEMPQKNPLGEVYPNRYILGHDPVDDDEADSVSLSSTVVIDLWTDRLVAECTGRLDSAEANFERCRLLCMFYNGKCLYENNKKGMYAYFKKMNSLKYLLETPQFLKDQNIIKVSGTLGNSIYGVTATLPINNFADDRIKDWLMKPVTMVQKDESGDDIEVTMPNLYTLKSLALLKECSMYNPDINVDRIRALGMAMIAREEKIILYGGDLSKAQVQPKLPIENDDFFNRYKQD